MILSYRGTAYQHPASTVESANTQQIGQFLGNRFEIKQFTISQRHAAPVQLKYRGVIYNA